MDVRALSGLGDRHHLEEARKVYDRRTIMQRMVLQVLLGISGLLMFFRFGAPALIFGATGPGPLGNRWLAEGNTTTLLLDSDLRFLGAMMLGLGVIFLWTISRVEAFGSVIYILACAVALGAAARIYGRIVYGNPGTAGTIPIVIESVIPLLLIFLRYHVGKDAKNKRNDKCH